MHPECCSNGQKNALIHYVDIHIHKEGMSDLVEKPNPVLIYIEQVYRAKLECISE